MIRADMAVVLAKVQIGDNRHVDGLVLDYWMDTIGDLDFETAMHALKRFRRERPGVYLEPGHLLELAGVVDERPSFIPDRTVEVTRALALERAGLSEAEAEVMPAEQLAARLAEVPAIGPLVDHWPEVVDDE